VRSFARSNQDLPSRFRRRDNSGNGGNSYFASNVNNLNHKRSKSSENDPRYSSSGAIEQPILAMGEIAYAQTYAGDERAGTCSAILDKQQYCCFGSQKCLSDVYGAGVQINFILLVPGIQAAQNNLL
jgi:hypothetical protein